MALGQARNIDESYADCVSRVRSVTDTVVAPPVLSTAGDASEAALSVRTRSVTPALEADPRDILFQKNTQPVSLELLNIRDTVFKIYTEIYT